MRSCSCLLKRALALAVCLAGVALAAGERQTRNVVFVTIDGLRWQEVFRGPDDAMANLEFGGVSDKSLVELQAVFGTKSPAERRRLLMPFFWNEIAVRGQLFGNRDIASAMRVTNAAQVSYPGYNEMFAGIADPAITNNARIPNPNVTVLEWLNGRPGFEGRVRALAAWNVFSSILNVERSHLPLWLTNQHSDPATASPRLLDIERWMEDVPTKDRDEHYDAFVYHAAIEALDAHSPRVLFVGFGEPDTYGHRRAYDRYVDSIRRVDRFIRQLWESLQSRPQYRGTTTLIVTTDHGRGASPRDWANHNPAATGSDETWLAVLGPDTPPLGERRDAPEVVTAQIAATLAALLGEDFRAAFPKAAAPIDAVLGRPER